MTPPISVRKLKSLMGKLDFNKSLRKRFFPISGGWSFVIELIKSQNSLRSVFFTQTFFNRMILRNLSGCQGILCIYCMFYGLPIFMSESPMQVSHFSYTFLIPCAPWAPIQFLLFSQCSLNAQ